MSDANLQQIEIARLRARVAELEREREALREVVGEQADSLGKVMVDAPSWDVCHDLLWGIERALRAALEE